MMWKESLVVFILVVWINIANSFGLSGSITKTRMGVRNMKMMPIGVPKVEYSLPGSRVGEWVDIYHRLSRERIIFVGSEINDEVANHIIGTLLYLDNENSKLPIYMYINSPGGSVIAGLAIYDAMRHVKSEIVTVNVGLSASMSSFLLCAGSRGRRFALPHSRIMIHQPMGSAQGQAEDIRVEASQILRIRNNIVKLYSMMTGQTTEQILQDIDRDHFLSADDALKYGIIDEIVQYDQDKLINLSTPPPNKTPDNTNDPPQIDTSYEFGNIDVPQPNPKNRYRSYL